MRISPQTRHVSNPEQAMRFLNDRLRATLIVLRRGDDDVVAATLANLPRGSRLALTCLGAMEPASDDPTRLALTQFGHELSACCAIAGLSDELREKLAELERERVRRAGVCDGIGDADE